MKNYTKLARNSVIFALSTFGSKIIIFLLLPLYTRVLTTSEFGVVETIISVINLAIPIITLSIAESVLRFGKDKNINQKSLISNAVLILFIGLGVFTLLVILLNNFIVDISYKKYSVYLIILFCVESYSVLMISLAKSQDKIIAVGFNGLLQTVIIVALNIYFLIVIKMGIEGYLVASIISFLISSIYLAFVTNIFRDLSIKFINYKILGIMLLFSLPLIPNAISWWLSSMATRYLVVFYLGFSYMGILSAAYKIPTVLSTIYSIFTQAWQLSIIEEIDKPNVENYIYKIYNIYMIIISLITICGMIGTHLISDLLFGVEFINAIKYVPILLVSTMFGGLSVFIGMIFIAKKDTKILFTSTTIGAVISIVLGILMIPKLGLLGASISTMIGYISMYVIRQLVSKKHIRIMISRKQLLSILLVLICAIYLSFYNVFVIVFGSLVILLFYMINFKLINGITKTIFSNINKKFFGGQI